MREAEGLRRLSMPRLLAWGRFRLGVVRFNRQALAAFTLILVLAVGVALGLNLKRDYDRAVASTRGACQNLSVLLGQQLVSLSRNVDLTLLSMVGALERAGPAGSEQLDAILDQHRRMLPEALVVYYFDGNGDLRAGGGSGAKANVTDREYFKRLRDQPVSGLYVGQPLVGKVSKTWSIPFVRRVNNRQGNFAGVAYVGISLEHLGRLFASLELGVNGVVALRDDALRLIVREPEPKAYGVGVGQQPNQEIVWQLFREGRKEGTFEAASSVDRIDRVFVMRRLDPYPLHLFVGQSLTDGLREWRHTLSVSLIAFGVFALVSLVFSALLAQSWRRQGLALAAARESSARYESVIAAMSEAIVVEDAEGRVLASNPAAQAIVGPPDGATGAVGLGGAGNSIVRENGEPWGSAPLPWQEAKSCDAVVLGVRPDDGQVRWLSVNVRPVVLPEAPGPYAIVTTLTDITPVLAAKDALRRINEDLERRVAERTESLQATNDELESALAELRTTHEQLLRAEKLAALGTLVAGVAHELNTPIGNGIMVASTMEDQAERFARQLTDGAGLRRSTLDEFVGKTRAATTLLQTSLRRAADLVSSFKQVAVDRASMRRRSFVLKAIVHEELAILAVGLRKHSARIEEEVPADIVLDSYPGSLGQAMVNLVDNAIRHGLENVADGRVRISAEQRGETVRIDIEDNGCGIRAEHLGQVFDPFFTTKLGRGGTGLGLHIAHNLVANVLGGSISVESSPGRTLFRLEIPLRAPEHAEAEELTEL